MEVSKNKSYVILIVGPTAVGKTTVCLKLAKYFKTEIISCDSRQFYREMELGTAKPSNSEMKEINHHLINSKSIHESYDVKQFELEALSILKVILAKSRVAVMTGGSGLFADAISQGLDEMPVIDPAVREGVIFDYEENGLEFLIEELKQIDPDYFNIVDQKNPQRLMRAIEVYRGTGKPFSSFRKKKKVNRPFELIQIGLELPREVLYDRINARMDQMIDSGLFEEAEKLFPFRNLNALQTVGYSEIFGFLEGKYDREEAVRLLKRNSRRYAKRQLTWFRKNPELHWFSPNSLEKIKEFVINQIR